MAKTVNLKTLQITLDRVSVSEFMKLPKDARAAFETLYDGLAGVLPARKGKTIAPPAEVPQPEPSSYPGPVPGVHPPRGPDVRIIPGIPEIPGASLIPGHDLGIPPPQPSMPPPPLGAFDSDRPPQPERPQPPSEPSP